MKKDTMRDGQEGWRPSIVRTHNPRSVTYKQQRISKQHSCPLIDKWINRLWYIYRMEYYSTIQRNFVIWDNMKSVTPRRPYIIPLICGIYKTKLKKQTQRYR